MSTLNWKQLLSWLNQPILSVGQTPVTAGSILTGLFIFLGFYFASLFLRRLILIRLTRKFGIDAGTAFSIRRVFHYVVMTLGVLTAIHAVGLDLSSITVILGFLSVGIGFGLQNITSNFISGIILLFERPVSVGDYITLDQNAGPSLVGIVQSIGLRSTLVRTFDNVNIFVPNSQFVESQVINWSTGDLKVRQHVKIGVAYGTDSRKVEKVLLDLAHNHPLVMDHPKPEVWFLEFGDSSLNFELLVWVAKPDQRYTVLNGLNHAINKAFRDEHIQIPFPQRDIHVQMSPAITELAGKKGN